MLMPPYHGASLRADEKGIIEHFAAVATAAKGVPLMVQDAPLSGTHLSVAFLSRLAREVPQVSYFKIEPLQGSGKAVFSPRHRLRLDHKEHVLKAWSYYRRSPL